MIMQKRVLFQVDVSQRVVMRDSLKAYRYNINQTAVENWSPAVRCIRFGSF